jgi:hypothetical protein
MDGLLHYIGVPLISVLGFLVNQGGISRDFSRIMDTGGASGRTMTDRRHFSWDPPLYERVEKYGL